MTEVKELSKGTPPEKKNVFFRGPFRATCTSFFGRKKTTFCAYDSENYDNYDNDGPMIIMMVILMIMITKNYQIKYKC